MNFTTILSALALTLSAPAFAEEAKGAETQSAPASAADNQERGTNVGRGTRGTVASNKGRTELL